MQMQKYSCSGIIQLQENKNLQKCNRKYGSYRKNHRNITIDVAKFQKRNKLGNF